MLPQRTTSSLGFQSSEFCFPVPELRSQFAFLPCPKSFSYFEYPNLSKFIKGEKECLTLAWKIPLHQKNLIIFGRNWPIPILRPEETRWFFRESLFVIFFLFIQWLKQFRLNHTHWVLVGRKESRTNNRVELNFPHPYLSQIRVSIEDELWTRVSNH